MIYVHIPYCKSFCTYCGFYSEIAAIKAPTGFQPYIDSVISEAQGRQKEILDSLGTNTLYIGGGTPTVLPLSMLQRLREALPYGPYDEFTVEANPDDLISKGMPYLEGLVALGVNRLSIGVQSFDDTLLKWMNRRHDSSGALRSFAMAREAGIENISVDLIFGISGLSDTLWRETLEKAVHMGDSCGGKPQHISAYQLSIETDSSLECLVKSGRYVEADEAQCSRQYDILCEALAAAGYKHYEVSNFAQDGFEARHNSAYWRRQPYVGLGAGAHSFDGSARSWNSRLSGGSLMYSRESELLSVEDERVETLMLSLRTARGVDESWLLSHTDNSKIERMFDNDCLLRVVSEDESRRIRIPENRFFISDEIIGELV